MKLNIINKEKELREMKADEKRVANDKLKYPKISGNTQWKSPIPFTPTDYTDTLGRWESARRLSDNPFG